MRWAGNPYTNKTINDYQPLEPRKSFAQWTEVVKGKGRAWTDEEKETASVLCLVYGASLSPRSDPPILFLPPLSPTSPFPRVPLAPPVN